MLTLAFDTSSSKGSVAILDDHKVLSDVSWDREVSHGELLTPALQNALEEAKLEIHAIDLLAIGHGPGSFTGVRVAVNAARALAYAAEKIGKKKLPVMAFDTAEILAGAVLDFSRPLLTLINAHKNLVYCASFLAGESGWRRQNELKALDAEALAKLIAAPHSCVGDGYLEIEAALPASCKSLLFNLNPTFDSPNAVQLGLLARQSFGHRPTLSWNEIQPLYIRASGAEEKLEEKRRAPSED